jgi:cell division protease FtsH
MPGTDYLFNGLPAIKLSYKLFLNNLTKHLIATAKPYGHPAKVIGFLTSGQQYTTNLSSTQVKSLQTLLLKDHIPTSNSSFGIIVISIVTASLLFGAIAYLLRQRARKVDANKAKSKAPTSFPSTRFSDLFGLDEVIEELQDLVYFLRNPDLAAENNIEVPKGYLFVGPPGTGKTELAKAVAGEAQVPFFAHVGSEFNNKYVGEGAANLRKAFAAARETQEPAVIFIDEIDAVGSKRTSDSSGGQLEHNATLNQLLSLLDGFHDDKIVVIGATNFPDSLDPALTRAGRLGVRIEIPIPDIDGRQKIFEHYINKHHLSPGISASKLARQTPAINGASVKNIVNTAAQLAWRRHRLSHADHPRVIIEENDFNEAISREFLGLPRTKLRVSDRSQAITAWHEAGHTLAALLLEAAEDPSYITIIPRGPAGGVTFFPQKEEVFMSKYEAMAQLVIAVSGRTAEELLLGDDITQGASNDFQQATSLAKTMVAQYGMTSMGIVSVGPHEAQGAYVGEKLHIAADNLLKLAQQESRNLIRNNAEVLKAIVKALIEEKTLTTSRLWEIVHATDPTLSPITPMYQELVNEPVSHSLNEIKIGSTDSSPYPEGKSKSLETFRKRLPQNPKLSEDAITIAAILRNRLRRKQPPREIEA